jgi:hypothetical protein
LPWAGAAFLGRERREAPVLWRVGGVAVLWAVALDRLTPSVLVLSLWSAVLVLGAFLVAPKWERLEGAPKWERPEWFVRQGKVGRRRSAPPLGARRLSPLLAWGRLIAPSVVVVSVGSLFGLVSSEVGFQYLWPHSPDRLNDSWSFMSVMMVLLGSMSSGLPAVVGRPWSLAPAAALPLPARSLWWGTLLGSVPISVAMGGALIAGNLGAALLLGGPIDPTPYWAFLAKAPLFLACLLFVRASWQLGFLLSVGQRVVAIVCGAVALGAATDQLPWTWSWVDSSFALAVTIGVLGLLAPRHYPPPS